MYSDHPLSKESWRELEGVRVKKEGMVEERKGINHMDPEKEELG